MNYMKLIKLLYLADREALRRWGRPITTDCYVSMDRGPALSGILNLISHGSGLNTISPWRKNVSEPHGYAVSLVSNQDPPDDELSESEEELIDEIFKKHGSKSPWALVDFVHRLPEWKDPKGSAIPIEYADILKVLGKSPSEIAQIESELRAASTLDSLCT